MNFWRWFIGSGEAGVLYYFDVPSIIVGFFFGVTIVLLIVLLIMQIRRRK